MGSDLRLEYVGWLLADGFLLAIRATPDKLQTTRDSLELVQNASHTGTALEENIESINRKKIIHKPAQLSWA